MISRRPFRPPGPLLPPTEPSTGRPSIEQYRWLHRFLISQLSRPEALTLDAAMGLMTNAAIGPGLVMPTTCLERIHCGDDPRYDSTEQARRVLELWMQTWNYLVGLRERDDFEHLLEDVAEATGDAAAHRFCCGFAMAMKLGEGWDPDMTDEITEEIWPMWRLAMTVPSGEEVPEGMADQADEVVIDPEEEAEMRGQLPRVFAELALRFRGHVEPSHEPTEQLDADPGLQQRVAQVRRPGSRVSRNEECPCGSGIKYKKCCGA